MHPFEQMLLFVRAGLELSRSDDERGEVSATTIIWAAALVLLAVAIAGSLAAKITAKSDSINF